MAGSNKRWLLPDGVQETLPPDAHAVESLRHNLLQTYHRWGYELVMPAMIEYMESLLTGTAHALDRQTFALVDQLSGRQMGVRSDMTPQVARIDAHLLADESREQRVARLCYCGHLLHAIGDGITSSRTPLQIGAEIFGSGSIGADVEVVSLMITTLHEVGLSGFSIDLGHVGIFRGLVRDAGLDADQETRLFDLLQRKSIPDLQSYLQTLPLTTRKQEQICQLALLNGEIGVIDEARAHYADASTELLEALDDLESVAQSLQAHYPATALDDLESVAQSLQAHYPATPVHCDLSELRGYSYHTGLVFAAFLPGQGIEIARGGRYDDVGSVFGNARPATGFSADLLNLHLLGGQQTEAQRGILAPDDADPSLQATIRQLRDAGERVLIDFSDGNCSAGDQNCDRQVVKQNGDWVVTEV